MTSRQKKNALKYLWWIDLIDTVQEQYQNKMLIPQHTVIPN